MSDYDNVSRGALKLKGVSDQSIKKKKKKKDKEKNAIRMYEQISTSKSTDEGEQSSQNIVINKQTKAEIAFEKAREKRKAELIIEKASKTHKERILEFNRHLDSLTEHFDIPKVSWTK